MSDSEQDPELASLVRDALRNSQLSDDALERIRRHVEPEWKAMAAEHKTLAKGKTGLRVKVATEAAEPSAAYHRFRARARRWKPAAAVLMFLVVAAGIVQLRTRPRDVVLGTLTFASPRSVISASAAASVSLFVGNPLRAGELLNFQDSARIALAHGGDLRIAPGTRIRIIDADRIRLDAGRVYAEFAAQRPRAKRFIVETFSGDVEHRGTQFEVSIGRDVHVRVREGEITFLRRNQFEIVSAGTELVVSIEGRVERRPIARDAVEWDWAQAAAPQFEIENRSLYDFLDWVSHETGKQIRFVANAERIARSTQLHGSVRGLLPMAALDRVISTTTLKCSVLPQIMLISQD